MYLQFAAEAELGCQLSSLATAEHDLPGRLFNQKHRPLRSMWYNIEFPPFLTNDWKTNENMKRHSANQSKASSAGAPTRNRACPNQTEQPRSESPGSHQKRLSLAALREHFGAVFREMWKLENFRFVVLLALAAISLLSRLWLVQH